MVGPVDAPVLRVASVTGTAASEGQHTPLVVGLTGGSLTIEQDLDGAGTGAITWNLYYWPLEASATVVAAS